MNVEHTFNIPDLVIFSYPLLVQGEIAPNFLLFLSYYLKKDGLRIEKLLYMSNHILFICGPAHGAHLDACLSVGVWGMERSHGPTGLG